MQNNVVRCKNILIVGDLHISDTFRGRHRNYLTTCLGVLAKLEKEVIEREAGCLVLAGDLVGWDKGNIRSREVLSILCKFFKRLQDSGIRVISVRGNHDFSDYPDFQFLSDLGLIETSQSLGGYFDFFGTKSTQDEVAEVRFHIVDYGMENRALDIAEGGVTNIVLGHNNYTIQGVTNWYQQHDGIDLANQSNFSGIYMVISGHIHAPSPELMFTDAVWGQPIGLFVLGCPTRPAFDTYTSTWLMEFSFTHEDGSTNYNAIPFDLIPLEEEYYMDENFVEDMTTENLDEVQRKENLSEILTDIMSCRISSGNLEEQIRSIPEASDMAKELAVQYLNKAMQEIA